MMQEGRKHQMASSAGLIFIVAFLIIVAYILGFSAGIRHVFNKMHEVLDFDTYRFIVQELHMDVEKEEEKK